jgi:peroxiredoxin
LETAVWQQYRSQGVVVLAINLNESKSTIRSYISKNGLTYPVLVEGETIYNQYGNNYIPYNVIIDKSQIVRYSSSGFNSSVLLSTIQSLID